ncbi:MAG: hypothetical protein ACFB4J_01320 [Elainellaceae cyanobacterium]
MDAKTLSEPQQEKRALLNEITERHNEWKKLRRVNSRWDGALTILTIVLTLFTTILGVEGLSLGENTRDILIGVSGGLVVAIQSIGNAFPVKQKAGGYKSLESQAYTLKSRLGFLQSDEEISEKLSSIQEQFYQLLAKSAELDL